MQVLRSNSAELAPEFGIMAGRWTQYSGLGDVPFGAMWCVVPPGGRSNTDCHAERELVVVVQGAASVQAAGGEELATAGSAVLLDGGEEHVLVNSGQEPLVVLSIYWLPDSAGGQAEPVAAEAPGA
jgi:mannose-6-phosphate isomerase-like protein (cupin superfamily)